MARFLKGFLVALIASVVVNLIILYVIGSMVINPAMPLHALSLMPVAMLTIIGVIGATIVYAIIRACTMRPNMMFIWISIVVLLLSFIPDYMVIGVTSGPFAGGTVPAALTLALMHVATAAIVLYSMTKLWGPKNPITPAAPVASVV